jgi:hypothetical protein
MTEQQVPVYREPRADAYEGEASLRHDVALHYWLGNLKAVTIQPQQEFTGITCTDGATHYIRTTDFQQVCPEPLRVVYCACGTLVVGLDNNHLYQLIRNHTDQDHPETELSDEQIQGVITANSFTLDHLQPA